MKKIAISYRTLKKSPVYTGISAVGFGVSISLLLIAVSFAWDRTSRDQFHPHPDRMYRVTTEASGAPFPYATSPPPLWGELTSSVRGVDLATRFRLQTETFARGDERFPHRALRASPSFFDLFGFPVVAGDARSALRTPTSVVLSSSRARSLFGTTNAVGQTVTVAGRGSYTVRAVVDTESLRSHIQFDAVYPLDAQASWSDGSQRSWTEFRSGYTYVRLSSNESREAVESRIQRVARIHWPKTADRASPPVFHLQALADILFGGTRANEIGGEKIPAAVIYFLGALAVLVILAAAFNYVSLGAARSLQRAQEVGIRKTLGGTRRGILFQFVVESVGVSLLAFGIAMVSTAVLLPLFNRLAIVQRLDAQISLTVFQQPTFYGIGLGIAFVVSLVAGAYPAYYLASHHPVNVLRGSSGASSPTGPRWLPNLRQVLTAVQLTMSLAFIVVAASLYQQSQAIVETEYGFPSDHILCIELPDSTTGVVADELRRSAAVQGVAHASHVPVSGARGRIRLGLPRSQAQFTATHYSVDSLYLDVMDLSFAARLPRASQRFASGDGVILNQVAATRLLGDEAPGLGDVITVGTDTEPVLGVIEGFRFRDITHEVGPLVLTREADAFNYLLARSLPDDTSRVRKAAERVWARTHPSTSFSSVPLHETISQRYLPYLDLMRILALASVYAVFVSCLGIMGMAAQSVEQRISEIGIRKAVGATSGQIVRLLLRETATLTAGATLFGIPLAAYLNSLWLSNFARQTDPGVGIYALAVLVTATCALATAATQAFRGAGQDVAQSLRHPDS